MIVVILAFFGLSFLLAANRPSSFVIFYVLASTKFLGFVDPAQFIVGGIELGYFVLNIIAIFSIFFKKNWVEMPKNSFGIILLIIAMIAYGILRPILNEFSSAKQAFIASKDVWNYAIFIYLIVYYDNIDLRVLIKVIKWLGIYLAANYFVYLLVPNIIPPFYYNATHVRTFFPTYISLSIFLFLIEVKMFKLKDLKIYSLILFQFLGIVLAGHSSLTVMTGGCVILYLFVFDENLELKSDVIIKFFGFSLFGISLALIFINGLYDSIVNDVNALIYSEDLALKTRDLYNKFRWDAINKQKIFGHGYIHQSSKFMNQFKLSGTSAYMERFTVIDSGYVDLLIKYGYLGASLVVIVLNKYFFLGFYPKYKNHITLAMSSFLLQYILISYTWSVYTFIHGIVPAGLAFYIILMYKDINTLENEIKLI